jgi:hypothetical protein
MVQEHWLSEYVLEAPASPLFIHQLAMGHLSREEGRQSNIAKKRKGKSNWPAAQKRFKTFIGIFSFNF